MEMPEPEVSPNRRCRPSNSQWMFSTSEEVGMVQVRRVPVVRSFTTTAFGWQFAPEKVMYAS
jgi:hypothetical protein